MTIFDLFPSIDPDDASAYFAKGFIQGLGRWTAAGVLPKHRRPPAEPLNLPPA
jgi:hypothetical protein